LTPFKNCSNISPVMSPISGAGAPGHCSPSLHPWRVESGGFTVTSLALQGTTGADKCFVPCLMAGATPSATRSAYARSRVITMKFTLGPTTPVIRLIACAATTTGGVAITGGTLGIEVKIIGGTSCTLRANNTNIAAGGVGLANSTAHTVQLAVYHDAKGHPYRARVYVDYVLAIDSVIPTALAILGLGNSSVYPYYEDGISLEDTASTVTHFAVNDITPEPPLNTTSALAYSASMTPDASLSGYQTVAVTNNTAFTVNAPTSPPVASQTQDLTIEFTNSSGGATTNVAGATWNAAFVLLGGALTDPASTKKRYIRLHLERVEVD